VVVPDESDSRAWFVVLQVQR